MDALDGLRLDLTGQPLMIKIAEAARLLGIGRTLAYQLASRFEEGDRTGLPVVRIGGCLRVPRWALAEFVVRGRVDSDLESEVAVLVDEMADCDDVDVVRGHVVDNRPAPMPRRVAVPSSSPQQLALGI